MTSKARQSAVKLERIIPAPPHAVYRAWLDPDLLRRWLAPGLEVKRIEVDERVGGYFRVWHARSGLDAGGFDCEIRVMIDPVILGGGKRLFCDDGVLRPLRLASSVVTSTGAVLASYARAAG